MKRGWILSFILFLTLILPQVSFSKDPVRLLLFYSKETGGLKIEEEIIKPLSKKYPIEVQSFSVNQLKNYDLLIKFEKELKDEANELPAIIIGEKILGGEAEIQKELERMVQYYAERGGTSWPSLQAMKMEEEGWIPNAPTEEERKSGKIIYGAFFICQGAYTARR